MQYFKATVEKDTDFHVILEEIIQKYFNFNEKNLDFLHTIAIDGDTGMLHCEDHFLGDSLHREDGPAYMAWHHNGQLAFEDFRINGRRHNNCGSAYKGWNAEGECICEDFWQHGLRVWIKI